MNRMMPIARSRLGYLGKQRLHIAQQEMLDRGRLAESPLQQTSLQAERTPGAAHQCATRDRFAAQEKLNADESFTADSCDFVRCSIIHDVKHGNNRCRREIDVAHCTARFVKYLPNGQRYEFQVCLQFLAAGVVDQCSEQVIGANVGNITHDGPQLSAAGLSCQATPGPELFQLSSQQAKRNAAGVPCWCFFPCWPLVISSVGTDEIIPKGPVGKYQSTTPWHVGQNITVGVPGTRSHGSFLRDELVFYGVIGEVGIALHAHFFKDTGAVGTDRLYRKKQLVRDLGHALAFDEFAEYLEFPLGKLSVHGLLVILDG